MKQATLAPTPKDPPCAVLVLVGCTKTKRGETCTAGEMFAASDLFRKSRAYAGQLAAPECVQVLSGKYGLLPLTETIAPYDQTVVGAPRAVQKT